jgi:hypothetical protein
MKMYFSGKLLMVLPLLLFGLLALPLSAQLSDAKIEVEQDTYTGCGSSPCLYENRFVLTATDLPTDVIDGTALSANDFNFFWNFGDGTFVQGKGLVSVAHTYAVGSGAVYNPWVEITQERYDDDPPKAVVINEENTGGTLEIDVSGVSVSNATNYPNTVATIPSGHYVKLHAARDPVNEDFVTYAIQYKNPCSAETVSSPSIELTYDPTYFTPLTQTQFLPNSHWKDFDRSHTESSVSNKLSWTFPGDLDPGDEGTIYVYFEVNFPATEEGTTINVNAQLLDGGERPPCKGTSGSGITQVLKNSHDPNIEISPNPEFCLGQPTTVDYTVQFQNTGTAPTSDISIKVWLDNPVNVSPIVIAGSFSHSFPSVTETISEDSNRKFIRVNLPGASLRGTGEPGYGTSFSDVDTKGHIRFQVAIDGSKLGSCHSVVSRAAIDFDCNEPIITNDVFLDIQCVQEDSVGNSFCDSCDVKTFALETPIIVPPPLSSPIAALHTIVLNDPDVDFDPDDYPSIHWFPKEGLTINPSNPFIATLNGNNVPRGIDRYTLVASKTCERVIIEVPIKQECGDLSLTVSPTPMPGLCFGNQADFALTVTGSFPPFRWNTCDTTYTSTATTNFNNMAPGEYKFSVMDSRNCVVKQTVVIEEYPYLMVEDDAGNCTADLKIKGGKQPYTVAWPSALNGLQTGNFSSDLVNGSHTITVTDDLGCTAQVTVQRTGPCGFWGWLQQYWYLALIAVVVLIGGIILLTNNGGG